MGDDTVRLTRDQARRIAVRAQLLDAGRDRDDDLLDVMDQLTVVQLSPTNAVALSQDLVLWGRLGSAYVPDELHDVIAAREVVEHALHLHPRWWIPLLASRWTDRPEADRADWERVMDGWVADNDAFRRDLLARLEAEGPLPASALPDTATRPWKSSGWTHDKSVQKMLDCLEARGQVAVAGRVAGQRVWDLAVRVHPDDPSVPWPDAQVRMRELTLRAMGVAWEKRYDGIDVGAVGLPATVEGAPGKWRVDPSYLEDVDSFEGRTVLLSPLDRLVFDRKRMESALGFEYQLEMYKPKAKRRWGYWALPVLHGDLLIGKVDATADHEQGTLRVDAVHEDAGEGLPERWEAARDDVHAQVTALADWLGLDLDLR